MADVTGFLADAKIELAQAKEETVQLNDRIKELQSFIAKKENLVETEGFLYDANDGKPIGLPYCPACQAKLGVFIRIAKTGPRYDDLACPGCRFAYKDDLTRVWAMSTSRRAATQLSLARSLVVLVSFG